ncbi:MAG: tetratricopeptide repeat protein [Candidatus Micrarchaeota archaeon]|nr:tetratricopeptide repeat protein [Candidatus Micrarchaeota archaeon]
MKMRQRQEWGGWKRAVRNIGTELAFIRALRGPDGMLPCFARGFRAFCRKEYGCAITEFTAAIKLSDGMHAQSIHYRGIANFRVSRFEEAIEDFRKVAELEPYFADAHGFLHLIYSNPRVDFKLAAGIEKRRYEELVGVKDALDKPGRTDRKKWKMIDGH